MNKITLGESEEIGKVEVDIPKLIDSRMLIQGNSGGGKSYLLRLICERASEYVPLIILDTEGEFATLREKVDAILIGPDGEVPTDLRSAAILPAKLIELRVSAIIDLYELKPHDRREYVRRFLDALINLPKELWHPTLIVIDEAHKLCPEKGQGDAVSTQSVIDLMSLGRKRGFAGILASQRFSKLHNDAIAEANNVCIGRTWMDADQTRAGKYLGMSASERTTLRELKPGNFYAFGPAFAGANGVFSFKSDKVATSHPKPGQRHTIKPTKPSDAIKQIVNQIEDLPEVAAQEAKTLAEVKEQAARREQELKSTIHALERELKSKELPPVQTVEKMIFPEEKLVELQESIDNYFGGFSRMIDHVTSSEERIERLVLDLRKALPEPEETHRPMTFQATQANTAPVAAAMKKAVEEFRPQRSAALEGFSQSSNSDTSLNKAERLILQAFYWLKEEDATPSKVGFYSGYSHKSGSFANTLSSLRGKGLLEGYRITQEGVNLASGYADPKPTGPQLREWLRPKLNKCENEILDVLVRVRGVRMSNEDIAVNTPTQYSHASGSFANAMSRLRTLDAIEGSGREGVKASEVFYS